VLMRRRHRPLLAGLLALLGSLCASGAAIAPSLWPLSVSAQTVLARSYPVSVPGRRAAHEESAPRLVVLVVFDQMRADYLERWRDLFGEGGFRRLERQGASFSHCQYPFAFTFTGPGHASIVTGCSPVKHGVVGDYWLERTTGSEVDCGVSGDFQPVPIGEAAGNGGSSPLALFTPTVGDVLKTATQGRARVVSLSLKDRSAVLMGGRKPDACYWLDLWSGRFMTSTYYRNRLADWVADFNRARPADRWFGKDWTRLRPELDYVRYSGPDDVPAEDRAWFQGRTFPHPMMGGLSEPGRDYYGAVACSPLGNELLLGLVKRAIEAEHLGRNEAPDLLCVSFSANDDVGHAWGPDSQEVLDMTLRSDVIVRDLLDELDRRVGRGRYLFVVTADHGVCPLPEVSQARGKDAKRIAPSLLVKRAEQFLSERFGRPGEKARWILGRADNWIYLNSKLLDSRKIESEKVQTALVDWFKQQPGVMSAFSRFELSQKPADASLKSRVQASFYEGRCGDVAIILKPYYLFTSGLRGTLHGSPHEYDTHVPLLVYGSEVAVQRRTEPVTPLAIAAILCKALRVPPPAQAEATIPDRLFKSSD
jgi:predicted AlkP superfamily pyrophosphatase or phosphodiesterase